MSEHLASGRRPPRQGQGIRLLREGGQCVLRDARGRRLYSLNETAAALWELCDGATTVDEMVEAVCLVCDVGPDEAAADLTRTLAELSRCDLIEW